MAQQADGKEDLSKKFNQENVIPELPVGIENSAGKEQESIHTVKSKIREKDVTPTQQEEDNTVGNLKAAKLSGSKISKFYRNKKSKSKTSGINESDDPLVFDSKTEVMASDSKLETLSLGSNLEETHDVKEVKSKKSLMRDSSLMKGKRTSNISTNESITNNFVHNETETAFVVSHDLEPQRQPTLASIKENVNQAENVQNPNESSLALNAPSEKNAYQRGNYLTNMVPEAVAENPPPDTQDEKKENKTD